MPVASGYSIQRNEIINIPHRQQYETHSAEGTKNQFFLRSKIDFASKDWEWSIKVGGVRYDLDRTISPASVTNGGNSQRNAQGVSAASGTASGKTDQAIWDSSTETYAEGDTVSGSGAVKFDQSLGVFGGIEFAPEYTPSGNEILEITYQEHETQWTGSRGGLLFQLASDMCIHPYDSPEIFKYMGSASPIGLSESFSEDFSENPATNTAQAIEDARKTARTPNAVYKLIREHSVTYSAVDISDSDPSNITPKTLTSDFPFSIADLGDGEFRVSIAGRVIQDEYWSVEQNSDRSVTIKLLVASSEFNWVSDASSVEVIVGFHWKHSLAVPFGAKFGPFDPDGGQITYTNPSSGNRATILFSDLVDDTDPDNPVATGLNTGKTQSADLDFIKSGDLFLLEFKDDEQFIPAFNLIHPKPVSNSKEDVLAALKQVTTKFLVESARGTDLLSDDELTPISTDPTSNKTKPQNWRIRFEYSGDGAQIKVNVATEYQLLDDMTITQGQGRDGAKYPIYREPGELCDVYQEPSIGRGVVTRIQKAKSQFFTRVSKSEDEVARSYPMSYRMTVTDHGMGLFIFDQASVDQDDDYSWFVVQRHVDQSTGQPEFSGKSPVHCVYSPTKRPVEISDLNTYYSTQDVADLSKPRNIFDSFGRELETEAPTIFVNRDQSFFNDFVNAIDFTGTYAIPETSGGQSVYKDELDVGFIGGADVSDDIAILYWNDGASDPKPINELQILGFERLGRSGQGTNIGRVANTIGPFATATAPSVSINSQNGASWQTNPAQQTGTQLSGNVTFPVSALEAVSNFEDATSQTPGPTATAPATLSDWDDPSYALLDILFNEVSANREKVFESLVVALDGVEILRDPNAYVLTYDEWVRNGDPSTVQRFLEGLDNAGVKNFGTSFKLPENSSNVTANFITNIGNAKNESKSTSSQSGDDYDTDFVTNIQGLNTTAYLVISTDSVGLRGKLPGDPIFSDYGTSQLNLTAGPNRYLYDFFNQTLYFRDTPRSGSSFSMKLVNYNSSTPSQTTYIVTVPPDRDLPDRNQNSVKTINRFIVRESDVLKPWDYHTSATMHEADSNSIINPQEQLSITQDRDFVFSFPTQLTSQRFYYPRSELDLIAISSADFSTQAGHIEIDKYSDSDGKNGTLFVGANQEGINPTGISDSAGPFRFAAHTGPDNRQYIWKKNKRKYEGMMSTEPNGNGMRVFLQVTGSSVRYSDVTEGEAPA
tara:strand:- start:22651 stop:26322 length:3672 start_codon:yes stop_codon:yes gene_type:complete